MLGHFLLRDWLSSNQPLAVVVRDRKHFSAAERIEQVVSRMEQDFERKLARPIVLSGNLHEPLLGLNSDDFSWVKRNCDGLLHSAASVKFYSDDDESHQPHERQINNEAEPYHSNVNGTKNALEFCRQTGIRNLHYVSTAYVCGKRQGRVIEDFQQPEEFGNDYEASKSLAEKVVRDAEGFHSKTILRPSIIVGDTRTGFSPAFHGIYTALQLGYLFLIGALKGGVKELTPQLIQSVIRTYFIDRLGLTGLEHKNLVPADWVSNSIYRIVCNQSLHNQTYHLTNPAPVSLNDLTLSMKDAVLSFLPEIENSKSGIPSQLLELDGFKSHMKTYRAYFRTDPEFDTSHVGEAGIESCPPFSQETLYRIWHFAIRNDFSSVGLQPSLRNSGTAVETVLSQILPKISEPHQRVCKQKINLNVTGPKGGNWDIGWQNSGSVCNFVDFGRTEFDRSECVQTKIEYSTFDDLINGRCTVDEALFACRMFVQSSPHISRQPRMEPSVEQVLEQLFVALQNRKLESAKFGNANWLNTN